MTNPAILVQGLGKRFRRYSSERPKTLMESVLSGWRRQRPVNQFWALKDISFSVEPGTMLGILGHNGAGKSTLLQLLGGVGRPDAGWLEAPGRIGALLDLGAGFHPDLTGRENIFVTAIAAGLMRREVAERLEAIIEFAELESFIDGPLRTYSTGMQMRLAFAVAIHTQPDILLVDEHLSVGDLAFQTKCLDRILQLKANGCAIVLISQSAEQIQSICDQALWLDQGRMVALGDPHTVAAQYASNMDARSLPKPQHTYSREVEIVAVTCMDRDQQAISEVAPGQPVIVAIDYRVHSPVTASIFTVSISTEDGQIYFNTHTATAGLSLPLASGPGQIRLHLERLDLSSGQYYINVGVFREDWNKTYDYHWQTTPLTLAWTPHEGSILSPPRRWELVHPSQRLSSPTAVRPT